MRTGDSKRFVAFGLCFESQVPLPGWSEQEQERIAQHGRPIDVHIRLGTVESDFEGSQAHSDWWWWKAAPGRLVLDVAGVARYGVSRGEEIIVEPAQDAQTEWIGVFAGGSALGALLHQRHLFPLHASVVVAGRQAVLFLGHTGAGKSTLAAALCRNGCRFVADDIAVISSGSSGRLQLNPGGPRLKLCSEAVRWLGQDPSQLARITPEDDKLLLPPPANACAAPLPLGSIYLLESSETAGQPRLERLSGSARLSALVEHTYRCYFVDGLGVTRQHFRFCTDLARRVTLLRLVRPPGLSYLDDTIRLLESSWAAS